MGLTTSAIRMKGRTQMNNNNQNTLGNDHSSNMRDEDLALEWIGDIGRNVIEQTLSNTDGTVNLVLEKFDKKVLSSLLFALLNHKELASKIEFRIPQNLKEDDSLPNEIWFEGNAGAARNEPLPDNKSAMITAVGSDEIPADTIRLLSKIDKDTLLLDDHHHFWVERFIMGNHSAGETPLPFGETTNQKIKDAIKGFLSWLPYSLVSAASYLEKVRTLIATGTSLEEAFGLAFPYLLLPKDKNYFRDLSNSNSSGSRKWLELFQKASKERAGIEQGFVGANPLNKDELKERLKALEKELETAPHIKDKFEEVIENLHEPAVMSTLLELDWELDLVSKFLTAKVKTKKKDFIEKTQELLKKVLPSSTPEETERLAHAQEYLEDMKKRQLDFVEDLNFFNEHFPSISRDNSLINGWTKYLYPTKVECTDFAEGLLDAIKRLFNADIATTFQPSGLARKIRIELEAKQYKSFSEKVNPQMMKFFNFMYKDLREILGAELVEWNTNFQRESSHDPLVDWEDWVSFEKIKGNKAGKNNAIKFVVSEAVPVPNKTISLTWNFTHDSFASSLDFFLKGSRKNKRINKHPIIKTPIQATFITPQETMGAHGVFSKVTLSKGSTLFAPASKIDVINISDVLQKSFKELSDKLPDSLIQSYEKFALHYSNAIQELGSSGIAYKNAKKIYDSYESLLQELSKLPDSEAARTKILTPIMAIGVIRCVSGETSYEIIPPWHPLRFFAISSQHKEIAFAIRKILTNDSTIFYGQEHTENLKLAADQPVLPQLVVCVDKEMKGGEVSFPVEHNHWFSLFIGRKNHLDSRSHPEIVEEKNSIAELISTLSSYDEIESQKNQPKKILAIDAESNETDKQLREKLPEGSESQIELTLQNEDESIASIIFNTISADCQPISKDIPGILEPFQTRVTNLSLENLKSKEQLLVTNETRPYHLATLHMLGSKKAEYVWTAVPWEGMTSTLDSQLRADRKKYVFTEETLSQNYLIDPVETKCSELYLRHAYRISNQTSSESAYSPGKLHFPILQIRTDTGNGNKLGKTIQLAHELADWVLTYDSLISKQQLSQNEKLIIRSKKNISSASNVIVSSSSSVAPLNLILRDRLIQLGENNFKPSLDHVAEKLFSEALTISGCVGLKAAKSEAPAGELMGLCLSKSLIFNMVEAKIQKLNRSLEFISFLMLDDYSSWFNNLLDENQSRDKHIADIIAFAASRDDKHNLSLHIIVTECKYCQDTAEAKRSLEQTKNTVSKLLLVLSQEKSHKKSSFSIPVWLNRFTSMILQSDIIFSENAIKTEDFYKTLHQIRNGQMEVTLNGYSHYFAFEQGSSSLEKPSTVGDLPVYQQIFSKTEIIELLTSLAKGDNLYELIKQVKGVEAAYEFNSIPLMEHVDFLEAELKPYAPPIGSQEVHRSQKTATQSEEQYSDSTQSQVKRKGAENGDSSLNESLAENTVISSYPTSLAKLILQKQSELKYCTERVEWSDSVAQALRLGLVEQGISVTEIKHIPTPNGCLVVYKGSQDLGQKVIEGLKERLLMTRSLRIGFTEAAEGQFRIFIESKDRESVPMWNIWKDRVIRRNPDGSNTDLVLALKELDGTILYLNPLSNDNEPHTLIAGGTGSGKSVLMRNMILDIAATNTPEQAQIYIVDPKMGVDYGSLRNLPHLARPIVSDQKESIETFDEVIAEMERRYKLFAEAGNENLQDYNVNHPDNKLPVIWLIHDELPQVMTDKEYNLAMTPKMKVLATKARAAGIFLILLAQRPDKDVLPPQIRDNLGNRLALKLPTEASSKIALDKSGAEFLLGKGHLAAKIGSRITYAQCGFLSREETAEAVRAICNDYGC